MLCLYGLLLIEPLDKKIDYAEEGRQQTRKRKRGGNYLKKRRVTIKNLGPLWCEEEDL